MMTTRELPTPALILDLDLFEANLDKMARLAASSGKQLRPHAKAHKCLEVARRQVGAGAAGVCVATVPEAEVMVNGGVRGVLLTSPLADALKMRRMAELAHHDPHLTAVVDHPAQVEMYGQAAAQTGVQLRLLVDLDLGDHRTGIAPGAPALQLAEAVQSKSHLEFVGLQAYSIRASHVKGFDQRREFSHAALSPAIETLHLLRDKGLRADILSVGSTGTFDIDSSLDAVTELQVGSYVFMDADYRRIGDIGFAQALRVLATVVSANHRDFVTIDAGVKAFATDRSFGPEPLNLPGVQYRWGGDEFGYLHFSGSERLLLGHRLELIPPHCDPTVNLYDRIYACRGDQVEEVWPIMHRMANET